MTANASPAVGSRRFDSDGEALEHGDGAAAMHSEMAAGRTSPDDPASCSTTGTMSTKTPPATAGTTDDDPTTNKSLPAVIGVDARGAIHRYDRVSGRLVVTDREQTVLHAAEMEYEELHTSWIPYIGRERGWIDHWVDSEGMFDAIDRLGMALKALDAEGDDR